MPKFFNVNSRERHEARFRRRKQKRELAKIKRNEGHGFLEATSFGALNDAYYKCRRGVSWKTSVLRYGENVLRYSYTSSEKLRRGANVQKGFVKFYIQERGKTRFIQSVHISERVIQKALCDQALVPVIQKSLIYDNGASQQGKGTQFATGRVVHYLHKYYRKYGDNEGYVVLGDAHAFFDSIRHDVVEENSRRMFTDPKLIELEMKFVNAFDCGLGLGSQVSQINAVAYANRIDHYIEEILRPEGYEKYMDDWWALCRTKEEAQNLLKTVSPMYEKLGIKMNPKKTEIIKLSHGFTWLKDRIYLTKTGKVILKPNHKKAARDRRKLKKLCGLMNQGVITPMQVKNYAESVKGYYKHKNGHRRVVEFMRLYNQLVIKEWRLSNEQNIVSEQERRRTGHSGSAYVPDQKREHRDLVFL